MRSVPLLLVLALVAMPVWPVRADTPAPPRPTRPEWDDPPAPLPDPPEEAGRRLVPIALLALGAGSAMAIARRRREVRGAR